MVTSANCITKHTAYIFDRGGARRIDQLLEISTIRWERGRDEMTEARLRIEADACSRQADLINSLRTHRHELVIYRGLDRVWEGPLHRIGSHRTHVEIVAKDALAYLFAQPLTQGYNNEYPNETEVTTRLEEIITYELSNGRTQRKDGVDIDIPAWEDLDPPINVLPHLVVHHWPNEARTATRTIPYEMTVGDHLSAMARSGGIDYTMVGRGLHIWDVSRSLGMLPTLTEADFQEEVIVTEYGADHTQAAYVIGQNGGWGQALNLENLDYYGPWTTVHAPYNQEGTEEPTQAELNSQASRNTSGRSPAPVELRVPDNSGIIMRDDIPINHLVCGVQIPVRATLNARQITQVQKLDHLVVTEDGTGETVQITLTPATKPDSDEE
jgi:hypothetical protein